MIGKLRGRTFSELRGRLAQHARTLVERGGFLPTLALPASMTLTPETPWPAVDAAAVRTRISAAARAALVARADRIVGGSFDVLGLVGLSYGSPVNWHRDPLSGREAVGTHWSRVPYLDHARVGDHKVTWELNRHQWLIALGQAWLLTGDARYPQTADRLLGEWLQSNPPKHGINWVSALEVAIRVQSWVHGLRFFADATELTAARRTELVVSAALQVDHVVRNLSTWFSPNTHLTGEGLAILSAGCAWPELPQASRWRALGWQILCDQIARQLRPDGVYFEQSAWYHAYTLDFYVLGMQWATHARLAIPHSMPDQVRAAGRALRAVTRPDGTIARLGDDDGGRALPLMIGAFGDMTDALWRVAVLLDDPSLAPPTETGRSALLWLEGPTAYDRAATVIAPSAARASQALRDGGWVTLTEQGPLPSQDHWLVFDAGPHGALTHAHAHADALGFDLSVHGVAVLVDPGTGAYVGEARRRYRSTAVHNTVTVDGTDSSEQGTAFNWRTAADTRLEGFGAVRGASFVTACHDGYQRLADPVRHHRTILRLDHRYWIMLDSLDARTAHTATLTWQAAPGARIARDVTGALSITSGAVVTHLAPDPRLRAEIVMRAVSPAYALELPASAITATVDFVGPAVFCTALGAADECDALTLEHDAATRTWRLTHGRGADLIARPVGASVTLGPARFDGAVLVVCGEDRPHTVVAAGQGTLHLADQTYVLSANDIRVAYFAPHGTWTMES